MNVKLVLCTISFLRTLTQIVKIQPAAVKIRRANNRFTTDRELVLGKEEDIIIKTT